jgi:hypothetical protein
MLGGLMQKKIVNLTPHPLIIQRTCPVCHGQGCEDCQQGVITETIESSGIVRVEVTETVVGEFAGVPVVRIEFGRVIGLPDQSFEPGSGFVVSSLAAQAAIRENPFRIDIFVPARLVRDAQGRIVACTALARLN